MQIRPEVPEDFDAIAAVVAAAFGSPAEAQLVAAIRSSPGYVPELALVADDDGIVVGHVMVSHVALVDGATERSILSLSPLAVQPEHQRRGIGTALVRVVTSAADARGAPFVVLEGDPAFYGRLGFEPSAAYGIHITVPSWAPPEAAQVLRLARFDATVRGRLVYPPAFAPFLED